jgi:hypothetical protein
MAMKMHNLRAANGGRGVYALSATPVTNSPFEIYNILSLCCPPEEFERFGVHTVDDFVRVFGRIETVDKVKVSGEIKPMLGLTGFQNLDGLRNLFHKYVNMKNANDVKESFELPPHDEINDAVELSEEQQATYEELRGRAKQASIPKFMGGSGESLFAVMRDMDRVTTDMDLYNKTMTFHFSAQEKDKVETILTRLNLKGDFEPRYESRIEGDTYVLVVNEEDEERVISKFPEVGIEMEDVGHPVTPKYAKLIERLKKHFEAKGKQIVFTDEKSQHDKIQRIITHEVPIWKDVIGIINADTANGNKMQKISDKYNSGKLKIVIANKKAEVGVNLQKGTTAIHHLTLPWTPASIQQRNGRGLRQGNKAKHISIYYYLGQGSFDEYRLDLLKRKSNWIRDLFTGSDASAENGDADNADEYLDMLESDPEEARKRRMERLEKEQARRQARENLISANNLQQLANAKTLLRTLDSRKEEERERLTLKVAEFQKTFDNYTERIAKETDKSKKADLQKKQDKKEWQLENTKNRLAQLDKIYDDSRKSLEAKGKQVSGLLRQRAKKGKLPFDESHVDHPENVLVSLKGEVLAKGDYYEVAGDEEGAPPVALIKIERVFQAGTTKVVDFETVTGLFHLPEKFFTDEKGENYFWDDSKAVHGVPFNQWPFDRMTKVSYSDDEIHLKKLLSERIYDYADLVQKDIGKDFFLEHLNEINFNEYGGFLFRSNNIFEFTTLKQHEVSDMVYPEPNNSDFRKNVCGLYLDRKRQGNDSNDIIDMMTALYGDGYEAIAMEYAKIATEKEIREATAVAYANAEAAFEPYDDPILHLDRKIYHLVVQGYPKIKSEVLNALGLVDNVLDVSDIVSTFLNAKSDEFQAEITRLKEELKQKELEEIKSNPDYREVPADLKQAFEDLGITVKTNLTNMVIPGFRGRKGTPVKPFKKWFFFDAGGYDGRLREASKFMKTRYKASFFKDADDNFPGAWWHVPIETDLKEVFELMED